MPLVVAGLLGAWFIAPLVALIDPMAGWVTLAASLGTAAVGGISELWP